MQRNNNNNNNFNDKRSMMTFGDNKQQNHYQGNQYEGKVFGKKQDDLQSMKSFQSDTGSIRTTSTNF